MAVFMAAILAFLLSTQQRQNATKCAEFYEALGAQVRAYSITGQIRRTEKQLAPLLFARLGTQNL
jgi:hypothetical protein